MTVTINEISAAILNLGLANRSLCIHSSLRSFGWVEGGAQTVVDAFLRCNCTIMVPTHSYAYQLRVPFEDAAVQASQIIFHPSSNVVDVESMGQISATVLLTEGRIRGNHPIDSFTAVGPCAAELVGVQTPDDVYAPVRELAKQDGYVVLMGVGLNKLTAFHLAEKMAGRQLYEEWVLGESGQPMRAAIGDCSDGFPNLDRVVAPIEQRAYVGKSLWRVFPIRPALELASEAIRTNPAITHCGRADCAHCNTNASTHC